MNKKNINSDVCPVCQGNTKLFRDLHNYYFIEIDKKSQEMLVWEENTCMMVAPISYCPACGKKLKEE